jgi:phenylalanyl-tRNA synthetase beta chain
VVVEKVVKTEENKNEPDEETTYKIEIPANRYDLLCVEGLGRAIAVYLGKYAFLICIFSFNYF